MPTQHDETEHQMRLFMQNARPAGTCLYSNTIAVTVTLANKRKLKPGGVADQSLRLFNVPLF